MSAVDHERRVAKTPEQEYQEYVDELPEPDREALALTYAEGDLTEFLEADLPPAEFAVVFAAQQRRALGGSGCEKAILSRYMSKAQEKLLEGGAGSYLMDEVAQRVAEGRNVSGVDLQLIAWALNPPCEGLGLPRLKEPRGDFAVQALLRRTKHRHRLGIALSEYARTRHGRDFTPGSAKLRALVEHDILWQSGSLLDNSLQNNPIRDAHLRHFIGVVRSVRAEHMHAVWASVDAGKDTEMPGRVLELFGRAESFLHMREVAERGDFPPGKYTAPSLLRDEPSWPESSEQIAAYEAAKQASNKRYLEALESKTSLVPQLERALKDKSAARVLELWAALTTRMLVPGFKREFMHMSRLRSDVCELVEPYVYQRLELVAHDLAPLALLQVVVDGLRADREAAQVNTDNYGSKAEDRAAYLAVMHELWEKRGVKGSSFRVDTPHAQMTAEYVYCQELARQDPRLANVVRERMSRLHGRYGFPPNLPRQVQNSFISVCVNRDAAGWTKRRHERYQASQQN